MTTEEKVKAIWVARSFTERADWIRAAGFTVEASRKYANLLWDSLPSYVRVTLVDHES
jgi:hypothetical protein